MNRCNTQHLVWALARLRQPPLRDLPGRFWRYAGRRVSRFRKRRKLTSLLCDYLQCVHLDRDRLIIRNVRDITTGWENELLAFTAEWGSFRRRRCEELVLRLYPGAFAERRLTMEYEALSSLGAAGYPVPRVDRFELQDSRFSKPFLIIEYVEGRNMWQPMLGSTPEAGADLRRLFCRLLARLHDLDWRTIVRNPGRYEPVSRYSIVENVLAEFSAIFAPVLLPGFRAGLQWLVAHQHDVVCSEPVMAHLDFHPGNILLRDRVHPAEERAVVIDWTSALVTDYRFDLAVTLTVIGAFKSWDDREAVLREYEREAGRSVRHLEFFEVIACFARLVLMTNALIDSPHSGLRPGIQSLMRKKLPAMRQMYQRFLQLTGVAVPEVERMLDRAETAS